MLFTQGIGAEQQNLGQKLDPEPEDGLSHNIGTEVWTPNGSKLGFRTSRWVVTTLRTTFGKSIVCVTSRRVIAPNQFAKLWVQTNHVWSRDGSVQDSGVGKASSNIGYRCHWDAEAGVPNSTAGKSVGWDEGRRLLVSKDIEGKLMTTQQGQSVCFGLDRAFACKREIVIVKPFVSTSNGWNRAIELEAPNDDNSKLQEKWTSSCQTTVWNRRSTSNTREDCFK